MIVVRRSPCWCGASVRVKRDGNLALHRARGMGTWH